MREIKVGDIVGYNFRAYKVTKTYFNTFGYIYWADLIAINPIKKTINFYKTEWSVKCSELYLLKEAI